jgi:hypothetical protein
MELNGIYKSVVRETGIVPEHINARCSSLATFAFTRTPVRAPRPGQKPVRKKNKR